MMSLFLMDVNSSFVIQIFLAFFVCNFANLDFRVNSHIVSIFSLPHLFGLFIWIILLVEGNFTIYYLFKGLEATLEFSKHRNIFFCSKVFYYLENDVPKYYEWTKSLSTLISSSIVAPLGLLRALCGRFQCRCIKAGITAEDIYGICYLRERGYLRFS